jgi:hypothetical protein
VIVVIDSPRERIGKLEICPILKEDIVGARLAGAFVIKTATLLGLSRTTVYVGIHEPWEDNIREEEQWAEINIDRNKSQCIEKDCFKKSENYWNKGNRTEYSF